MIKYVTKKHGHIVLLDDSDAWILDKYVVVIHRSKSKLYAYVRPRGAKSSADRAMHRVLLGVEDADWRVVQVDHVNGDSLDNRRSNLRLCSPAENAAAAQSPTNKTGYRGVQHSSRYKWYARCGGHGAGGWVEGPFDSPEEAARAYDNMAIRRYGEFATLNFPGSAG